MLNISRGIIPAHEEMETMKGECAELAKIQLLVANAAKNKKYGWAFP